MFEFVTICLFALVAAALMAAGHYLGPRLYGRELSHLQAYAWGCGLGIYAPFSGWCVFQSLFSAGMIPTWLALLALLSVMIGAGLGTVAGYAADEWVGCHARERLINRRATPHES